MIDRGIPSALFLLYDAVILSEIYSEEQIRGFGGLAETIADRMDDLVQRMLVSPTGTRSDDSFFSPYTPYALYQTAVVRMRLWRQTGYDRHRVLFGNARMVLEKFTKRWLVAKAYLQRLDDPSLSTTSTSCYLYQGRAVSGRGPTGDDAVPYRA
jgi:hypothetical protein